MKNDTSADPNNTSRDNLDTSLPLHKYIALGGKPEVWKAANC